MRVTIGIRLGLVKSGPTSPTPRPVEPPSDDAVPTWVAPEKVLRLADLPSCKTVPVEVVPPEREGPPRVRGEMVWLHKTAPVLVIEGRPDVSPDDHAAGRRR
jgi:hypothetical protein